MEISYVHCKDHQNRLVYDYYLIVLRFYDPVNPMGSCQACSVYLTTHLLGRFSPLCGLTNIVHILSQEKIIIVNSSYDHIFMPNFVV